MRAKKEKLACSILIFFCLFIAGCWDRHELEARNFVLAVGIDNGNVDIIPGVENMASPQSGKPYRLSLQIVKPKEQGGGKDKGKTYVISNTGESMFEMIRDMLGQSSKSLWFEHLHVIIISEAVLKQTGLAELLDFFIRDSEMRSRIKIYVTSGRAQSLLEYKPPSQEIGGIYLAGIVRLHTRNIHVNGAYTDLGFTSQYLDSGSNILLPRIELADKEIKLGGSAVFNKDQFIGYADEYAIAGLKMIAGTEQSAIVTVPDPIQPKHQLAFELYQHETKLRPHIEGDGIYFSLDIVMYGNVGEVQGENTLTNTMDPQVVNKIEMAVADEIKQTIGYAQQVFQKQMKVDSVGIFANKMRAYEPDSWETIKGQWEEIYPQIPIIVSVTVHIENIGSHQ